MLVANDIGLATPVLRVVQRVLTRHLPEAAAHAADEGRGGVVTLIEPRQTVIAWLMKTLTRRRGQRELKLALMAMRTSSLHDGPPVMP